MNGTVPTKVARVVTSLLLHPRYISRCLVHNLLQDTSPLELELPWFSYAAIDFLQHFLQPHMTVAEYGSGGSTLFFARRVQGVFCVEDNPEWFEAVSGKLRANGIDNVTLRLCPFDFKNPAGFESSGYLRALPDERFDVVVVDGSEEWTPVRPVCFEMAEKRVKRGGIVMVDDSWRYPVLRRNNHASGFRVFKSVGPCRPGVTTTDVFFY